MLQQEESAMKAPFRLTVTALAIGAFLLGPSLLDEGADGTGTPGSRAVVAGGFEWAVAPDGVGGGVVDGGFEWA
ncbi:hypothetical protein ACFOW4_13065 [Micromonospora sp. GCM10011542]